MKMLIHIKSGAFRSLKAWKGILVTWILYLIVVCLLVLPFKAGINNMLGNSMITELLHDGIIIDVLTDFGPRLGTVISSFSAGFLFVLFVTIVMNAFITGGLFSMMKSEEETYSGKTFFEGGASNFWSFLIITVISSLIIIFIIAIVLIIPLALMSESDSPEEGFVLNTMRLLAVVVLILLPVIILATDKARAWKVLKETKNGFRSLGNGFRLTFRNFFSSYLMMILLLSIQIFYTWIVIRIISGNEPVTGGGVFMLFILSQVLFIAKIFLRAWRYGSIISLVQRGSKKMETVHAVQTFEI